MSADRVLFTGLPAVLTLALHGGLVLMLVVRWTGPSEVIAAADRLGIAMILTGVRHFRH